MADLQSAMPDTQTVSGKSTSGEQARRPDRARTKSPETDPALTRIIAAWPTLPEPIRRAMLALVGSNT